jgi:hypothetical protein
MRGIEVHHVIHGTANRKLSDKYGLVVGLCYQHHRGSFGVHGKNGQSLNLKLKIEAQETFTEVFPDLSFREIFGKNYTEV